MLVFIFLLIYWTISSHSLSIQSQISLVKQVILENKNQEQRIKKGFRLVEEKIKDKEKWRSLLSQVDLEHIRNYTDISSQETLMKRGRREVSNFLQRPEVKAVLSIKDSSVAQSFDYVRTSQKGKLLLLMRKLSLFQLFEYQAPFKKGLTLLKYAQWIENEEMVQCIQSYYTSFEISSILSVRMRLMRQCFDCVRIEQIEKLLLFMKKIKLVNLLQYTVRGYEGLTLLKYAETIGNKKAVQCIQSYYMSLKVREVYRGQNEILYNCFEGVRRFEEKYLSLMLNRVSLVELLECQTENRGRSLLQYAEEIGNKKAVEYIQSYYLEKGFEIVNLIVGTPMFHLFESIRTHQTGQFLSSIRTLSWRDFQSLKVPGYQGVTLLTYAKLTQNWEVVSELEGWMEDYKIKVMMSIEDEWMQRAFDCIRIYKNDNLLWLMRRMTRYQLFDYTVRDYESLTLLKYAESIMNKDISRWAQSHFLNLEVKVLHVIKEVCIRWVQLYCKNSEVKVSHLIEDVCVRYLSGIEESQKKEFIKMVQSIPFLQLLKFGYTQCHLYYESLEMKVLNLIEDEHLSQCFDYVRMSKKENLISEMRQVEYTQLFDYKVPGYKYLTLLEYARKIGNREAVQWIKNYYSSPEIQMIHSIENEAIRQCFDYVRTSQKEKLKQELMRVKMYFSDEYEKQNNQGSLLMYACLIGNTDMVNYLQNEIKLNINDQNIRGETALMIACQYSQEEVISQIIIQSNVNLKDKNGRTALYFCCKNLGDQSVRIARLLFLKGAELILTNEGNSILTFAIQCRNMGMAWFLYKKAVGLREGSQFKSWQKEKRKKGREVKEFQSEYEQEIVLQGRVSPLEEAVIQGHGGFVLAICRRYFYIQHKRRSLSKKRQEEVKREIKTSLDNAILKSIELENKELLELLTEQLRVLNIVLRKEQIENYLKKAIEVDEKRSFKGKESYSLFLYKKFKEDQTESFLLTGRKVELQEIDSEDIDEKVLNKKYILFKEDKKEQYILNDREKVLILFKAIEQKDKFVVDEVLRNSDFRILNEKRDKEEVLSFALEKVGLDSSGRCLSILIKLLKHHQNSQYENVEESLFYLLYRMIQRRKIKLKSLESCLEGLKGYRSDNCYGATLLKVVAESQMSTRENIKFLIELGFNECVYDRLGSSMVEGVKGRKIDTNHIESLLDFVHYGNIVKVDSFFDKDIEVEDVLSQSLIVREGQDKEADIILKELSFLSQNIGLSKKDLEEKFWWVAKLYIKRFEACKRWRGKQKGWFDKQCQNQNLYQAVLRRGSKGKSLLMRVAERGNFVALRSILEMIEQYEDEEVLHQTDQSGKTVFYYILSHIKSEEGRESVFLWKYVVAALINYGWDLNGTNKEDRMYLLEILELLKKERKEEEIELKKNIKERKLKLGKERELSVKGQQKISEEKHRKGKKSLAKKVRKFGYQNKRGDEESVTKQIDIQIKKIKSWNREESRMTKSKKNGINDEEKGIQIKFGKFDGEEVDVNRRFKGKTLLQRAVRCGDVIAVKKLVDKQADIFQKNSRGETLLEEAVNALYQKKKTSNEESKEMNYKKIIIFLIHKGVHFSMKSLFVENSNQEIKESENRRGKKKGILFKIKEIEGDFILTHLQKKFSWERSIEENYIERIKYCLIENYLNERKEDENQEVFEGSKSYPEWSQQWEQRGKEKSKRGSLNKENSEKWSHQKMEKKLGVKEVLNERIYMSLKRKGEILGKIKRLRSA